MGLFSPMNSGRPDNGLHPGALVVVAPYRLVRRANSNEERYAPTKGMLGTVIAVGASPLLQEYEDSVSELVLVDLMGYGLYWVPALACQQRS